MGYVLVLGACLVPPYRSVWLHGFVLGGALAYGSLLGVARVIQGGHFLSDVLWSGSLMCFLVAILQAVLLTPAPPDTEAYHPPPAMFNTA
jgi:membrane-associated PAP2 superfamily phosphatase